MVEEASPSLPPRKGSAHRSGRALWRGEELEGLSCALRSRSRLIVLSRGRLWHRPRRHHGLFKITGDAGAPRRFRTGGILKDHHPVHGAAPRAYGPSNKAFTQGHGVVPIPSMPQCRRSASILGGRPRNRSNRTSGASLPPRSRMCWRKAAPTAGFITPLSRSGRTRPLPAPRPTCSCNTPPHSLPRRYAQSCFQSDSLRRREPRWFPGVQPRAPREGR